MRRMRPQSLSQPSRAAPLLWRTASALRSNASSLRLQTPEIVDDVPDVGLGQLVLVALHVERRSGAIADHHEDLAVAVAAIPFRVGQVRRMRAFGRHGTVALG